MDKTCIILVSTPEDFDYLTDTVRSIRSFTVTGTYELIVVEGSYSSEVRSWLAEQTDVRFLISEGHLTSTEAWNKGIQAAVGDSVLLMHNDVLVTDHWLDKLQQFIELDNKIGAVGPLTNVGEGAQSRNKKFQSINELLEYVDNLEQSLNIEYTLNLFDFCILLPKNMFDKVGLLDERMNDQVAVIDLILRIYQAGFKAAICHNAFVYHYEDGSKKTSKQQQEVFYEKWNFNMNYTQAETGLISLVKQGEDDSFNVLVMGPGCGASNMYMQQCFPNSSIYGLESSNGNEESQAPIYQYQKYLNSGEQKIRFDYIILTTLVEDFEDSIKKAYELVGEHGKVLFEISNVNNIGVVKKLLQGHGIQHNHYYSLDDIIYVLQKIGYQELDIDSVNNELEETDKKFIESLNEIVENLPNEFEIKSYLITAYKTNKNAILHTQFSGIFTESQSQALSVVLSYPVEQIVSSLESYEGPVVSVLNFIALEHFQRRNMKNVLSLLDCAYQLDSTNDSTLLNLATVMYSIGEEKKALNWLNQIQNKNDQMKQWAQEIKDSLYQKNMAAYKLKFLLRRIENDVDRDAACQELTELVQQGVVSIEQVYTSIDVDIVDKVGTLNKVAVVLFQSGLHEWVIPLLEKSYTLEPINDDTLYNLSYVLYKYGAYQESFDFLKQINIHDEDIMHLRDEVKEKIQHERV